MDDLQHYVEATGDTRPVLWLVERFLANDETRKRRAMAQLEQLLPHLQALVKAAS